VESVGRDLGIGKLQGIHFLDFGGKA